MRLSVSRVFIRTDTREREVRRAESSGHPFAVLLDFDELKRTNDRLGHLAGNRALKRLADVLKEQGRSMEVGRHGPVTTQQDR